MGTYIPTYICKKQTPPPLHARTRVHVSHHSVAIHVKCCMYVRMAWMGRPGGVTHTRRMPRSSLETNLHTLGNPKNTTTTKYLCIYVDTCI